MSKILIFIELYFSFSFSIFIFFFFVFYAVSHPFYSLQQNSSSLSNISDPPPISSCFCLLAVLISKESRMLPPFIIRGIHPLRPAPPFPTKSDQISAFGFSTMGCALSGPQHPFPRPSSTHKHPGPCVGIGTSPCLLNRCLRHHHSRISQESYIWNRYYTHQGSYGIAIISSTYLVSIEHPIKRQIQSHNKHNQGV